MLQFLPLAQLLFTFWMVSSLVEIPALVGQSQEDVATILGEPTVFENPPYKEGPQQLGRGYNIEQGGTIDVEFCDDAAYEFRLNLASGLPSSIALLEAVGLDVSALPVSEASEGFEQRSGVIEGRTVERLTLVSGSSGWRTLLLKLGGTDCP